MSYELLLLLVEKYEKEVGDNKAKDFYNWIIDNIKPNGMDKLED